MKAIISWLHPPPLTHTHPHTLSHTPALLMAIYKPENSSHMHTSHRHVHTHTHTHTHTHIHTTTHTETHTHTLTHTHTHTPTDCMSHSPLSSLDVSSKPSFLYFSPLSVGFCSSHV